MRIIVVGCGTVGATLAYQLYKQGHLVTVIEQNEAAFEHLPTDFQGQTIEGDVLTQNVLQRAQLKDADAVAVVTGSDSLNVLVAHIARTEYQVNRVVAANTDPRQRAIQEAFGIPVVGGAGWETQQLIDLLVDLPLRAFHIGSEPHLIVYQLRAPDNWQGQALEELLPAAFRVLSISRSGQALPVSNRLPLEAGDLIYLTASPADIETLKGRLGLNQEGMR